MDEQMNECIDGCGITQCVQSSSSQSGLVATSAPVRIRFN
jgi:hypothetical protein